MINMTKNLNFKIVLVIFIVGISLVVWISLRESRKFLLDFLFPAKTIHILIKGNNSQRVMSLPQGLEIQIGDSENLLPFNGQIILEK